MYKVMRRRPATNELVSCAWEALPPEYRRIYKESVWNEILPHGAFVFDTWHNVRNFINNYPDWQAEVWRIEVRGLKRQHWMVHAGVLTEDLLNRLITNTRFWDRTKTPEGTYIAGKIRLIKCIYKQPEICLEGNEWIRPLAPWDEPKEATA